MTEHFSDKELVCKCGCGKQNMQVSFMAQLEGLRMAYDKPIILNSAYRCQRHDRAIGGAGVHPEGRAIDARIYGEYAYELAKLAFEFGFTGIGFNQKGPYSKRFIHLDNLSVLNFPRPRIWTY